jgi:hypothetical protein
VPKVFFYDGDAPRREIYLQSRPPKRYGLFSFIFDCVMIALTGGFWLVWVFVRESRKR